jgi:hypothetical protein
VTVYSPNVACWEVHGEVQERRSLEDWTASVQLMCAWNDRHLLAADIVGFARDWPHGTGIIKPQATSAAIEPFESAGSRDDQAMAYEHALVTVNYTIDDRSPADLASESIEPSVEYITVDHRRFRWGSATGPPILEQEAPGKPIYSIALVRTIYNLPSIPASILTLPGTCNQSSYSSDILGLTFPAESLAFMSPSMQRTITIDGDKGWTLTLKWAFREGGWNQFWRPQLNSGAGGWQALHVAGQSGPYKNITPVGYGAFLP